MSGPYVQYAEEVDAGVGQSFDLWNPVMNAIADYKGGNYGAAIFFEDNFIGYNSGATNAKYVETLNSGTVAMNDEAGGVIKLASTTTADQGPQIQLLDGTTGEFIAPEENKTLIFEARFKITDVTVGPTMFIGLHSSDTSIVLAGAIDDGTNDDFVGFAVRWAVNSTLVLQGVAGNNTSVTYTTATAADALHTMVDGTYIKAGFRISGSDGSSAPGKVDFWINGVQDTDTTNNQITTTIPTALMTMSAAIESEGTNSPDLDIDWWQVCKVL